MNTVEVIIGISTAEFQAKVAELAAAFRQHEDVVSRSVKQVYRFARIMLDPTQVAIDAGITEADIRSADVRTDGVVEVRLWNHRRIEVTP